MHTYAKVTAICVGLFALTASAFARKGADDPPGDDRSVGNDDSFHSAGHHSRKLTPVVDGVSGRIRHQLRLAKNREDLWVGVKFKLGEQMRRKDARKAVIVAQFPDNSRCELDFDHVFEDKAYFELHMRSKNGVFVESDGDCDSSSLPSVSGGTVNILHDVDDDRSTDDTVLMQRHF